MASDRADLEALALRVEREEPSRELDAAVAAAAGWSNLGVRRNSGNLVGRPPRMLCMVIVPRFAASLDAAASLMPQGWVPADIYCNGDIVTFVYLKPSTSEEAEGTAPDEPRARTAAALRASAQEVRDDR